jgi:hypothetical protein
MSAPKENNNIHQYEKTNNVFFFVCIDAFVQVIDNGRGRGIGRGRDNHVYVTEGICAPPTTRRQRIVW